MLFAPHHCILPSVGTASFPSQGANYSPCHHRVSPTLCNIVVCHMPATYGWPCIVCHTPALTDDFCHWVGEGGGDKRSQLPFHIMHHAQTFSDRGLVNQKQTFSPDDSVQKWCCVFLFFALWQMVANINMAADIVSRHEHLWCYWFHIVQSHGYLLCLSVIWKKYEIFRIGSIKQK